MFKLLYNMKAQWKMIVLIIIFLFVQAFCDLSLPNLTSKIIDVGITNSGIEYATPTIISEKSYQTVAFFMTNAEREQWTLLYIKDPDGNMVLTDTSKDVMIANDEMFTKPLAIALFASQQGAQTPEQAAVSNSSEIRTQADEMMKIMGDSMLHSTAVSFTKAEYETLGINLDKKQTDYLWKNGAIMLSMALALTIASIIVGFLSSKIGANVGRDLRAKVFGKVVSFSNTEINKFSTASLITRTTNDIQQVQMVSTMMLRMIFYSPILAIGGIIMVLRTGAGMGWIIAIALLLIGCIVAVLMKVAMPKFKLMQKLIDKVNLVTREILTGLFVIRAFGREKNEEKRFDDANTSLTKTMLFTNRTMTFMFPLMMLIMNAITILIMWVSAHKIDSGVLDVGAMTAFISYTMQIVMSFLILTAMSIMLPRASVASERINEVINTNPSITDALDIKSIKNMRGKIAFDNVSFKYDGAQENTLDNISFETSPGEITAVIGSTGCGKSTLVQLIPRFYDVTSGSITVDGIDIRDLPQKYLRGIIGYVPQKGILFSGTIDSNLRFGNQSASETEVAKAAQIAQAIDFINEKEEGFDSLISQGGGNVSGGQKQRLSIARAVIKNPKIYIFDDSFSALDFKTDIALRKALSGNIKDASVIIVAQRISTVLHADRILVLDDGKLVGNGKHNELMKTCEVYEQIASTQLSKEELVSLSGGEGGVSNE